MRFWAKGGFNFWSGLHAKNVKRFRDFIFNPPITVGFLSSPFMSGGGGGRRKLFTLLQTFTPIFVSLLLTIILLLFVTFVDSVVVYFSIVTTPWFIIVRKFKSISNGHNQWLWLVFCDYNYISVNIVVSDKWLVSCDNHHEPFSAQWCRWPWLFGQRSSPTAS